MFIVLLVVVFFWMNKDSPLPKWIPFKAQELACSGLAANCPAKGNANVSSQIYDAFLAAAFFFVSLPIHAGASLAGNDSSDASSTMSSS